ncbi:MAG: serine hydrolase, partial [Gemmatimonadales bacterium]
MLQLAAVASTAAQQAPVPPADVRARLEEAVGRYMRDRGIPGLSLAIGAGGRVVLARGFGQADLEHG